MGEAATPDGMWIPILCVFVLFHDVCGGAIVVYADVTGWKFLSGLLSVSSMARDEGIWLLGSLGGEVCCWGCSSGCIVRG